MFKSEFYFVGNVKFAGNLLGLAFFNIRQKIRVLVHRFIFLLASCKYVT
jgi:hypothetical protein